MGRFSKKSNSEVEVRSRVQIGDLWYEVTQWNDKPTLNIYTERDDEYSLFRFQQFPKAEALVEAASVIEHFAKNGTLPGVKTKKKGTKAE